MFSFKSVVLGSLALSLCGCATKAENTYKVENVGGVPRMVFNGEPVRARMLYVSPTYFLLGSSTGRTAYAGQKWVETFYEIPPLEKAVENATIDMDMHGKPYECHIRKLEIIDLSDGKKVYELDVKNDPRVKIAASENVKKNSKISFEKFEGRDSLRVAVPQKGVSVLRFGGVKFDAKKKYRINLEIKAKKTFDFATYAAVDGKLLEPKKRSYVGLQTKLAADAGVDMITFPVQAADFMPEDGKSFNYANLKGALDEIVAANPDAKILLRIRFYPPLWWMTKYSGECMTEENGKSDKVFASPMSKKFLSDSGKVLRLIIDYCEANYGKNMMGYHPAGGNSCEWFYGNSWGPQWYGYGDTERKAWKAWVAKKYPTDEALQKSWNNPSASVGKVEVPTVAERKAALFAINPKTQKNVADYNMFLQDAMVDAVKYMTSIVREKVPNKISATFYGYTCEFSTASHKGAANTGHYGLWKLLKSPDIDFISGPISYRQRNLGDGSTTMGAAETVTRCGKIWYSEDDTRTHRVPPTQQQVTPLGLELRNLADTKMVMRRNMAQQAVRNNGSWWMDLSGTGWHDDPELWTVMREFDAAERDMIKYPIEFSPEIALIADEISVCYGGANRTAKATTSLLSESRHSLNECAANAGCYLFDDFAYGKPMSPKLAIFAVDYAHCAKDRKIMREKSENIAAIFVWIPAYIDLDKNKFSAKAVEEATGFKVKRVKSPISAKVVPTAEGAKIGLDGIFGFDDKVSPLLSPEPEEGDIVLAKYSDDSPAIVLRGKHLFCGISKIPVELYKHMIKLSGARVYSKEPMCVFANGAYVSATLLGRETPLHEVEIDVGGTGEIFDALANKKLGDAPKITLKMKGGDTVLLRRGNGNADIVK